MEKFRGIFGTDEEATKLLNLSDAELRTADGSRFEVHRIILARSSKYFLNVFSGEDGKKKREFNIPGLSGECLGEILIYIYTGKVSLTNDNVIDVLISADYLLIEGLINEVKDALDHLLNIDNCVSLLFHAYYISRENIFDIALCFAEKRFDEVVQEHRAQLAELPLEVLLRILRSRKLHIPDERLVWCTVVGWIEKDFENRLSQLPLLLKHLARKDIGEDLAKDIMSHSLVKNNPHCVIPNGHEDYTSLDILNHILGTDRDTFKCLEFRNPAKLHVVAKMYMRLSNDEDGSRYPMVLSEIYVTYDESLYSWLKVVVLDDFILRLMVAHRHNLYLFANDFQGCKKLDLKTGLLQDHRFEHNFISVVKYDNSDYLVSGSAEGEIRFLRFDEDGGLSQALPSFKAASCRAAAASGNIYAVGYISYMTGQMFALTYDAGSQTWIPFPEPQSVMAFRRGLVAYHEKLFLMGSYDSGSVEVFDPPINEWRKVQDLPLSYREATPVVLDDNLYVFEGYVDDEGEPFDYREKRNLLWNESKESWQILEESTPVDDLRSYRFCELEDGEIIKFISKGSRYPLAELQKSDFNLEIPA